MSNLNPTLDEALAGTEVKKKVSLSDEVKKASAKISAVPENDPGFTDRYDEEKKANLELNMRLNAIKIWVPMITAVCSNVHAKSEEDASVDLHKIVRDCSDITSHVLKEMESNGYDVSSESNKWVMRTLLANVSESVTRQYATSDKVDVETTKRLLSQAVSFTTGKVPDDTKELNKHLAQDLLEDTKQKITDLRKLFLAGDKKPLSVDEDTAITCSIMKASEAIIEQLEMWSWFADKDMHINKLSEIVISGAGYFYEKLLEDMTVKPSRSSRLMLLQSAIDKSSKCLAASYKKEAHDTLSAIKEEIKQKGAEFKPNIIQAYKGVGIPYDKINEAFERSLGLHISFTKSGAQFLKTNLGGLLNAGKKHERQGSARKPI